MAGKEISRVSSAVDYGKLLIETERWGGELNAGTTRRQNRHHFRRGVGDRAGFGRTACQGRGLRHRC